MLQLSHLYMTTGKTLTIALTIWTFVGKVMSLVFNTLFRFVIAFLPRSKRLLIMAAVTIHSDGISWEKPTEKQMVITNAYSEGSGKTHVVSWK